jgi:hypothetical protein
MSGPVHAALDGHLAKLDGLPPIVWENVRTDPPKDGSAYLIVAFMPGNRIFGSLGVQGSAHERGIYQVGISAPGGSGSGAAEDVADRIIAHFTRRQIGSVRTLLPYRSQAAPDEGRLWLPVSIPYFVETF